MTVATARWVPQHPESVDSLNPTCRTHARPPEPPYEVPMAVTEAQVIDALRPVQDPELHRSIVDLGMVRDITINGGDVLVVVALTIAGCPLRAEIDRRVREAVQGEKLFVW